MEKCSVSTRKKILDAMYDLVAEVGYDKASIGKICDFVGISKPSVYYYFPSKEEIFTTLLDSMFPTIDYQRDYSLIVACWPRLAFKQIEFLQFRNVKRRRPNEPWMRLKTSFFMVQRLARFPIVPT